MLKPGSVVIQDKVFINNRIEAGNERRLSVVLFSESIEGEDYVCSCPITSTVKNIKKNPQNYCHIPYMLLGETKFGVVRIADLSFWKENTVHSVGLQIDLNNLQKIYNSVLRYEPSDKRINVFSTAKNYIERIDLLEQKKEEERRQKAERRVARREAKIKRKQRINGGIING